MNDHTQRAAEIHADMETVVNDMARLCHVTDVMADLVCRNLRFYADNGISAADAMREMENDLEALRGLVLDGAVMARKMRAEYYADTAAAP